MIASYFNRALGQIPDKLICAVVLAGLVVNVYASDVVLAPLTPIDELGPGDIVELNVLIDFSDIPGGTLGGGFDIDFDDSALKLLGVNIAGLGDPSMGRDPDVQAGTLESWAVGDFDGLAGAGQVMVGTVQFRIIAANGDNTLVSIGPTTSLGGPWISGNDFVSELAPGYNQVTITFDPDDLYSSGFESP